jgi:hypothetical protein
MSSCAAALDSLSERLPVLGSTRGWEPGLMVDQLGIEPAVAQATPVVEEAPPGGLARLLTEAAQQVLPPRMATAFRLRYGLDRAATAPWPTSAANPISPGNAPASSPPPRWGGCAAGAAWSRPAALRWDPAGCWSPRPRPWSGTLVWGGHADLGAGTALGRAALPASQGRAPVAARPGRDALAADRSGSRRRSRGLQRRLRARVEHQRAEGPTVCSCRVGSGSSGGGRWRDGCPSLGRRRARCPARRRS